MARRRGDGSDPYTFDLEPDGDEEVAPARAASGPRTVRAQPRGGSGDGATPSTLLIDLDVEADLDDLDPEPSGPGAAEDDDGSLRRAWDRLRRFLHGRRLVAAVVLAALALTAAVVDTVGDRSRIAALRAAPGGVLDLTDRPRETWRVEAEGGLPGGLVGVVDGVVVVQQRDLLLGVDVATGDSRWRARLPDGTSRCGPGLDLWSGRFHLEPADLIVCVSATAGQGADPDVAGADGAGDGSDTREHSAVTVVDADGTVLATRTVGKSHTMLFPGPGGGLVVAEWVGDAHPPDAAAVERLTVDDLLAGAGDVIDDGYDLRVRLEDATTGDRRWQRTLRFDGTVDPSLCVRWSDDGSASAVDLRGGVQTLVRDQVLWVAGCGIDAWLTADGARLDRAGDPTTFEGFAVEPLAGGGYVTQQDAGLDAGGLFDTADEEASSPTRLLGPDGQTRRTLEGRYLAPLGTDGGGGDVHLVRRDDEVAAFDDDGDERWAAAVPGAGLAVRTGRTAVVVDEERGVHGLDLATGEEVWARDDVFDGIEDPAELGYSPSVVEAAFTDGRYAAFVVSDYARGDVLQWLALDVATGEELWRQEMQTDQWGVHLAVDGHLVRWTPTAIVGLG
ncbi:hypothetical protein GCM10009809_21320 [Isoptericola hypogeus]|uniref:Pyrrolo-quinoline quinone repeat domain-containing protein n=1 Tax=Isoptericola hypogeus TaxID=300179 RepID=A0ABP4VHX5_9MICO